LYNVSAVSSIHFDEDELQHPDAKKFGCDPDFDAWTNRQNEVSTKAKDTTLRTFAGHVHIGAMPTTKWMLDPERARELVRFLDVTLGFMSVVFDNTPESKERKELYGKAGCHRLPPHGVEYRVLSNFWTRNYSLKHLVYFLTKDSVQYCHDYDSNKIVNHIGPDNIVAAINEGDTDFAENWLESLFSSKILSKESDYYYRCYRNSPTYYQHTKRRVA
jgi:hypothetical protein